jgi:hypothetical protein
MKSTPAMVNWISRALCNSAASPDRRSLAVLCVKSAPALQGFSSRRLIQFGEIYDGACAGELIGKDRFAPVAEFEGNDERW